MSPNLLDSLLRFPPPEPAPERTVLGSRPSSSIAAFTAVGTAVDSLVARLLELRAADQKAVADEAVRSAFTAIFPPETRPLFNLVLYISEKLDVREFARLHEQGVPVEELMRLLKAPDEPYVKREIDGALEVVLPLNWPRTSAGVVNETGGTTMYTLVEMKLFTSPPDDPCALSVAGAGRRNSKSTSK
ncbi:MAG: hypothetical protein Kow0069_20950 [Promethearchaeota archaeon]